MKKLIYGILSGMLFTGCTSDELLRRFSVASASDWVNGAGVASYENLFWQEEIATKVATNGFAMVCRTTKFVNDIMRVKMED